VLLMASSIPRPRPSLTVGQGSSLVMKVPLGSRVVLSRRRNGTVRYVGKLTGESGEWYGVALDEPKGDNEGMRGKDRYFFCPPNHGAFVRRKEIYCVKEPGSVLKGPPSPVTDESSSCNSNASYTSADQQGDAFGAGATGVVHPAPAMSDSAASPLMKTFRGFRKQLDFISLRTVGPGRSREASPVTSPASSSPSSPTGKSGLKPPSPFRRFASFSQGSPPPSSPGSPANKPIAAAADDKRRQSAIPLSPKKPPFRRTNSLRTPQPDNSNDPIRLVESTSPPPTSRFSSFQYSPTNHFPLTEDSVPEADPVDEDGSSKPASPTPPTPLDEAQPEAAMSAIQLNGTQDKGVEMGALTSSSHRDPDPQPPVHVDAVLSSNSALAQSAEIVLDSSSSRRESQAGDALSVEKESSLLEARPNAPHVPPIDLSVIAGSAVLSVLQDWRSGHTSPLQDVETKGDDVLSERTRSFRLLGRSSSFRVPTIDTRRALDAGQGETTQPSPPSSSENSSSVRSNSFAVLSSDRIAVLDDDSEDGQGSRAGSIAPSPRDDISEASAASAPEPRLKRSPRSRQEHTVVESMSPGKADAGSGERPLFFRRTNVGHSPMERRSSYSSFSNASSSPPKSPTSSNTASASSRSSRVAELEREISAMRSSHENIVAVLRATNKQHAANVLELRAQVAALTEGNLWLERQLTAKGELVRELREMEKHQQRDNVSVSEVQKILEIKDAQIQTLEREMAQLRHRLARLEADKDSQLYQQFQHFEARRERDERRINELRKEVLAMVRPCVNRERGLIHRLTLEMLSSPQCTERLELQSEMRDLKEMTLRFF